MFKFVDGLVSNKPSLSSKNFLSTEKDSAARRKQHSRSDSGGKRNSLFSSRADGLLFLPGDHISGKQATSEHGDTASRRSSMSAADSRNSSERSISRSSSIPGRKFVRLSRKHSLAKESKASPSTEVQPINTSPVMAGNSSEVPQSQNTAVEVSPQMSGARRMISQPYDFQHVKHTTRDHLKEIHRPSQHDPAGEFDAVANGPQLIKGANGVEIVDSSNVPQSCSERSIPSEQTKKVVPPRPKRSDELLSETAAYHADTSTHGLRHVRSAETFERNPDINIAKIASGIKPPAPRQPVRRNWVDGPTVKSLGVLGARLPTGSPPVATTPENVSADPRWSVFATSGFSNQSLSFLHPSQTQSAPTTPYADDPLLSPCYGKELGSVPEEPEESRSQRASANLQLKANPPVSPLVPERPPLPIRSPSRSQQIMPPEPVKRAVQALRQPVSRVNSNASDTLGGFIHKSLASRQSNSSLLSTATGRSRAIRRGHVDSINWEDEIDFAYEHHMEAHCDLDWANVSKRETTTSVETVPELDHSASSSARSTQDGSMLPPPPMSIDILATVKEALNASDASSGEESFRRRKPQIRDASRESFLYDDGRPDLGLLSSQSDLEDPSATMSATTVSGSEAPTPADNVRGFTFPMPRKHHEARSLPSPTAEYQQDMYEEVMASYEKATRPSLDVVVEQPSADEASPPRRQDTLNVAEARPFQRASLLMPLPQHSGKHQKSASAGMVTDFAVAALKARLQEASQLADGGPTPRQSSRLSASNLKLHTMVSQLRPGVDSPSTTSEVTEDPASISSSQASLKQVDGVRSMAPSSTASDDIFDALLPPPTSVAPPIPLRSRSRLGRVSLATVTQPAPMPPPTSVPVQRKLHSASASNHHIVAPRTHVAHFSPRSESFGTFSPVMTVASEEPISPVSPVYENKALPPLPSPPLVRSRSVRRSNSGSRPTMGIATLATPVVPDRPASKDSAITAIHSPTFERPRSRGPMNKVEKPMHHRTVSRTSLASSKYNRQIRHWNYEFGAIETTPKSKRSNSNDKMNGKSRPFTQYNMPSQEILAMGSDQVQRPTTSGGEFKARQYSEMSPDQPPPTFVTTPPARNASAGFTLFPAPTAAQAKQKSRVRHVTESARLDRVLTALQ